MSFHANQPSGANRPIDDRTAGLRDQLEKAQQQLADLQQLCEGAPVGLGLLDRERRLVRINTRLANIYGLPADDCVGKSLSDILPELARQIELLCRQVLQTGEPVVNREVTVRLADGTAGTYLMNFFAARDADGEIRGVNTVVEDVSRRTAAERELRRSNEALRRASENLELEVQYRTSALKESEERWRSMTEHSPSVIMILDRESRIQYINFTVPELSRDQVVGRSVYDFVPAEFRETMEHCYRHVLETGESDGYEVAYVDAEGATTWYDSRVGPHMDSGRVVGLTVCAHEITRQRLVEKELARQRSIVTAVVENMTEGVVVADEDGKFLLFNQAAEALIGRGPFSVPTSEWPEKYGLFYLDRTTPFASDQLPLVRALQGEKVQNQEIFVRNPGKPDGVFISVNAVQLILDDGTHCAVAVVHDITEAKAAERRLVAEERLLRKLLELQESERKMIAHEIHDGLVQDMVGAQMFLEAVNARAPDDTLQQAVVLTGKAIVEARRLIRELRPMVMDDEGVIEAIRHHLADIQRQWGLDVELHCEGELTRIESRLEGAIYRVVQEALNNVQRHAQTRQAKVSIVDNDEMIVIEVEDRGAGFDTKTIGHDSFGLRGIRERARLFGGRASISSCPGEGTKVHVEFPFIRGE